MRHWSLIAMECCPFRSPPSVWRRFPGGVFRSSTQVARSTYSSFRTARRAMSGGSRLDLPFAYSICVCLSAKVRITNRSVNCHVTRVNVGLAEGRVTLLETPPTLRFACLRGDVSPDRLPGRDPGRPYVGKWCRVWATDRLLWVALHRLWPEWHKALMLLRPDTVIAWHRKGFRLYWRWKSRRRCGGRPATSEDIRKLIREMSCRNVL
jgi:hypothetical protein